MLTAATRTVLRLDELREAVAKLLPAERTSREATSSAAINPQAHAVEKMRTELRQVVNELDQRLLGSLDRNRASMVLRYVIICVFCGLLVVAVVLALVNQSPTAAVIGGLIPLGPIGWFLSQLRTLQDERIWLMQRVAKFQPLIATCSEISCLQGVARQVYDELHRLGSPVTAEAVLPDGTTTR